MADIKSIPPVAITSATTTTIVSAPATASDRKRCKPGMLNFYNAGGSTNTITLRFKKTATSYEVKQWALATLTAVQLESDLTLSATDELLELVTTTTDAIKVTGTYIEA